MSSDAKLKMWWCKYGIRQHYCVFGVTYFDYCGTVHCENLRSDLSNHNFPNMSCQNLRSVINRSFPEVEGDAREDSLIPAHLAEWSPSPNNKYALPAPSHLSTVNPFRHGVMLWDKQGQRPFVMIARLILIGQLSGLENCHWVMLEMLQTLLVLLVWDDVETNIVICYLSFITISKPFR